MNTQITVTGTRLWDIRAKHGGEAIDSYIGNPIAFSLWPTMIMTAFLKAFDAHKLFTPGARDCGMAGT